MAANCAHKDETRQGVSATAHGVAFMRSLEATVDPEMRLFFDPFAVALAGEVGRSFVEDKHGKPVIGMINGMSVRTKRIDDEFERSTLKQICVFGAGLDTRAWRLKKTAEESVHYFEVDFEEVFAFKLSTLEAAGAVSEFQYHPVRADLSVPGWSDQLIEAGFNPSIPTFFILEGFVNYLTQEEVSSFFTSLSTTALAAKGSRLVMTCATPVTQASVNMHNMHRFFPEHPMEFFGQFGWQGKQELVEDLAVGYGRPLDEKNNLKGYYIISAELS